ncbi:MAG TPA: alpha/beta hydrolase [Campylobacterales bacterium]|nr:alpha/beta hydrolase [Campylobacterales bacterium]
MAVKEINYKKQTFKLSYEMCNPSAKKGILILHGWGSNKEIMKQAFSAHFDGYRQTYLDLPGFGGSSNEMILTTEEYAYIVRLFIKSVGLNPTVIIGHSFGGKVATLLNPNYLVLLSSSGILVPKPLSVRIKIAIVKFLKPLGLGAVRQLFVSPDAQGMSHEMYETFKNVVNEEFEHHFAHYQGRGLLFWGKEDTATPLYTGEKIAGLIDNSKFYPLDGDHYFFLKHAQFIADEIKAEIES